MSIDRYPFSKFVIPLVVGATSLAGALLAPAAVAQEEERRGAAAIIFEEIVVTARKREESAQEVPLAITAYSADQIEALLPWNVNLPDGVC